MCCVLCSQMSASCPNISTEKSTDTSTPYSSSTRDYEISSSGPGRSQISVWIRSVGNRLIPGQPQQCVNDCTRRCRLLPCPRETDLRSGRARHHEQCRDLPLYVYHGCVFADEGAVNVCFCCVHLNTGKEQHDFRNIDSVKCCIFLKTNYFSLSCRKEVISYIIEATHSSNFAFNLVDTFRKYLIRSQDRTYSQCLEETAKCNCSFKDEVLHCVATRGQCIRAKRGRTVSFNHCMRKYGFNPSLAKPS